MLERLLKNASFKEHSFCRISVGNNFMLSQLWRCWLYNGWLFPFYFRCTGVMLSKKSTIYSQSRLEEDNKCQIYAIQQTDIAEVCPAIALNDQALEVLETFCYLGDTISARGGAVHIIIARTRIGWSKIRDLLPLIASKCAPLGTKVRLYW